MLISTCSAFPMGTYIAQTQVSHLYRGLGCASGEVSKLGSLFESFFVIRVPYYFGDLEGTAI